MKAWSVVWASFPPHHGGVQRMHARDADRQVEHAGCCSCQSLGSMQDESGAVSGFEQFSRLATDHNIVPVYERLAGDQITPVVAFSRLVHLQGRAVPSFLFESVQNGTDTGRFSFVGTSPALEILAKGHEVVILNHTKVWTHFWLVCSVHVAIVCLWLLGALHCTVMHTALALGPQGCACPCLDHE
jgi:hypothetical protein